MIGNRYNTTSNTYYLDKESSKQGSVEDNTPYFYINGYNFRVGTNAQSKSEINLVKNKMYVPGSNWGYTDIQWTNFTGEELTIEVYSRVTDVYYGEHSQPANGGNLDFYNVTRTPHAVLKYWAQTFVICHVETNLHAFESADYVIDEFSQTNPDADFVVTKLTLLQYEKPGDIEQTFHQELGVVNKDTSYINAQTSEVRELSFHGQQCYCTDITDASECTASYNEEVELIQKLLQQWGYFPTYSYGIGNIEPNGKFCWYTTQALRKFQEDRGIEVTGNFDEITRGQFMRILEGI